MKHYFLSCLMMFVALQMQATDIIFGNCHYREIEGRYAGYRKTESYTTFETDDRITLVYCLRIPRDSVSGTALLQSKITGDVTLNVRIKNCETDEVLLDESVTQACTRNKATSFAILPKMKFPADTWYRIEIQAPDGYNRISRLIRLEFELPTCAASRHLPHTFGSDTPQNRMHRRTSRTSGATKRSSCPSSGPPSTPT